MARAVPSNYPKARIYPFRELCLGYLLICKDNLEATVCLLDKNLGDQINYINRNMFEMVVTLFYISDDKSKKEERTKRYFDYNDAVVKYRHKEMILKHKDIFPGGLLEEQIKLIDQHYKKFENEYHKPNRQSWSGLKIDKMIESLSSSDEKDKLLKHYQVAVYLNNQFLHPSILHIRSAFKAFFENKSNHHAIMLQVMTTLYLAGYIVDKFLSEFQKGRPAFQTRVEATAKKIIELEKEYTPNRDGTSGQTATFKTKQA